MDVYIHLYACIHIYAYTYTCKIYACKVTYAQPHRAFQISGSASVLERAADALSHTMEDHLVLSLKRAESRLYVDTGLVISGSFSSQS